MTTVRLQPLEAAIVAALAAHGPLTTAQLTRALAPGRAQLATATVRARVNELARLGLVVRVREGRDWHVPTLWAGAGEAGR